MLARALPSILPRMTLEESLDVTRIYSIEDLLPADTAQGSIILIRDEDAYVIKDSKGQWRIVPPFPFHFQEAGE